MRRDLDLYFLAVEHIFGREERIQKKGAGRLSTPDPIRFRCSLRMGRFRPLRRRVWRR